MEGSLGHPWALGVGLLVDPWSRPLLVLEGGERKQELVDTLTLSELVVTSPRAPCLLAQSAC